MGFEKTGSGSGVKVTEAKLGNQAKVVKMGWSDGNQQFPP